MTREEFDALPVDTVIEFVTKQEVLGAEVGEVRLRFEKKQEGWWSTNSTINRETSYPRHPDVIWWYVACKFNEITITQP